MRLDFFISVGIINRVALVVSIGSPGLLRAESNQEDRPVRLNRQPMRKLANPPSLAAVAEVPKRWKMTPPKCPSIIKELMTWMGLAVVSLGLAVPLVVYEHRIDIDRVVTDFITPPMNSANLVPVGGVNYQPLASPSNEIAFLNPDQQLLKDLSDRRRARLAFSKGAVAYEDLIEDTAHQHRVSPILVKAVIQAESSFNPGAISHKGAVGLMQVMPTTARMMGVHDPADPQKNIVAGVKYLKILLELFNDDERLAIAAYNCGPEALRRNNYQIPYRETRAFVDKVMSYYNQYIDS